MNRRTFNMTSLGALGALAMPTFALAGDAMNQRIVLVSRPSGKPTQDNFRIEQVEIPSVGEGQILLKTRYLSLDPYMRGRMSAARVMPTRLSWVM